MAITPTPPNQDGKQFDHVYYLNTHMPMSDRPLRPLRYDVDRGLGGGAPGAPAPYVAGCHFYYASPADFQAAITANIAEIQADIPKYADTLPAIQISEIVATVGGA